MKNVLAGLLIGVAALLLVPARGMAQELRACVGVSSCAAAYGKCTARRKAEGLTKLNCEWSRDNCNSTGNWIGGKFNDGSQVRCKIKAS